jgi:hypothetical protein
MTPSLGIAVADLELAMPGQYQRVDCKEEVTSRPTVAPCFRAAMGPSRSEWPVATMTAATGSMALSVGMSWSAVASGSCHPGR